MIAHNNLSSNIIADNGLASNATAHNELSSNTASQNGPTSDDITHNHLSSNALAPNLLSFNETAQIAIAIQSEGGAEAVSLNIAQQYVEAFGRVAQEGTTLLLPTNASDPSSMVAQVRVGARSV